MRDLPEPARPDEGNPRRLEQLLEVLPDAFAIVDREGCLLALNAAGREFLETVTGIDPRGRSLATLAADRGLLEEALRAWGGSRSMLPGTLLLRGWGGEPVPVGLEAAGIDAPDATRLLLRFRRIGTAPHNWQRLQQRLAELQSELESARSAWRELTAEQQSLACRNDALNRLAHSDPLTGIGNRLAFEEVFPERLAASRSRGEPLALVLLDVDEFKRYNDALGHAAGDRCLRAVARVLAACSRGDADLVARVGGEEFALVLAHCDLETGVAVAERARHGVRALRLEHPALGEGRFVTVSGGVASAAPGQAQDSCTALFERADEALYRAKHSGRDRIERAPPDVLRRTG